MTINNAMGETVYMKLGMAGVGVGFGFGGQHYDMVILFETAGEKGLMASADISGTRFWVDDRLN